MNSSTTIDVPTNKSSNATISLFDLFREIAEKDSEEALAEFHNHRTAFTDENDNPVLFTAYLHTLRDRALSQNWNYLIVEKAVDLTQDKFTNFPQQGSQGRDCRKYFQAVLSYASRKIPEQAIEAELQFAYLLQRFVQRHFQFSLKEVKRCHNWSRYTWMVNGSPIQISLPRFISGRERRIWLETHVGDVNPHSPSERERIQSIIEEHFGSAEPVSLDDTNIHDVRLTDTDLPWKLIERVKISGLVKTVADEKADRIEEQRPAIRALGKERVRELVVAIFDALSGDDTNDRDIADAYKLSRPTYSRWAGRSWQTSSPRNIPTLWANTAHVLAHYPLFREAAVAAGIWKTVETITSTKGIP